VAPLRAAGDPAPAGVVVLEPHPHRPYDAGYREFLRLVAAAIGTAMSAAVRHVREIGELRRVSETLQLSMLPGITGIPGVVARYLPAVGSLTVGGDWYDVLRLDGTRLAVLVGDCVGQGLTAATVMGQLRSASRALLLDDHGAAATLEGLDRFAHSLDGAECATVFCGIVDTAAGTLTYARAGHLPPLVVRADGITWLDDAGSLPLGILAGQRRREATVPLAGSDTLVLFTDGLVERRAEPLDVSLDRLGRAALALGPAVPLDVLANGLLDRLIPHGPRDDVALLLHRANAPAG
jgi:serine phosphatase RsbU (regulator of sigma subunit)